MNVKHKWLATVGVAGAALLLAACSNSSSSSKSKSITLSTDSEISTMDLSKSTALGTFNMLNNTEEGLYRLGKNSKTEKAIAKTLTKSKDGKTYTITLRHGVKWSNGDTVTPTTLFTRGNGPLIQKRSPNMDIFLVVSRTQMPFRIVKRQPVL